MNDGTFVPPSEDEWIEIIDIVLARNYHHRLVGELNLSQSQADCLASTMLGELKQLNQAERKKIVDSLSPLEVSDIATQQYTVSAMRQFAIFVERMDQMTRHQYQQQSAVAVAASIQLNLETYYIFVYLKESLIEAILALQKTHHNLALVRASQRLMKDDVKQLRNAFAHAAWAIREKNGNNVFTGWDDKSGRSFEVSDAEMNFLRLIAFAISAVVVKELK